MRKNAISLLAPSTVCVLSHEQWLLAQDLHYFQMPLFVLPQLCGPLAWLRAQPSHGLYVLDALRSVHVSGQSELFLVAYRQYWLYLHDSIVPVGYCWGRPRHKHRIQYSQIGYVPRGPPDLWRAQTNTIAGVAVMQGKLQHTNRSEYRPVVVAVSVTPARWVPKYSCWF